MNNKLHSQLLVCGGMEIRAVIFDFDGVIAETEHIHIQAEKQTMLKYGVKISEDELHEFTGTTARYMFTELIRRYGLSTTYDEIFNEKDKTMFKLLENDVQPTRGVIELLWRLKKKNIKLGIGSSSHRKLITYVLKKLEIENLFEAVIGAEDITYGKPNPEIFLKCARMLGTDPAQCLVVEDAALGLQAAKAAGMICLGYRNPHSGKQDLAKADFVTDDFTKLDIEKLVLHRK